MVDIDTSARATQPLMPRESLRDINASLIETVDRLIAEERHRTHERNWKNYLQRHTTPPTWRGRKDIYHYDRLLGGLIKIVRTKTLPRVRYADYLRQHVRSFEDRRIGKRDISTIWRWFRSLDCQQRERFLQIQRDEEAEAKRYERVLTRLRNNHAGYFPESDPIADEVRFEGWEWEKTRYSVPYYESSPRTAWRSRPAIHSGARRTRSNSAERNRFYSCE